MANPLIAERTKKIIGENIRRFRKESGRTVVELTASIDMPRPYWYELEAGAVNYTVERLEEVAGALGVKVRDLLTEPKERNGKRRTKELTGGRSQ
jgi:transcriptional regulator with XRE-family HTH domain